ncbi:TonB-dependent receptor [Polymorphobacter sp.]|uniref:TonB-dependent receptor n=1 Tax=Polymorphobacter sp. TaxID=1909290 RepID=UPI003F6E9967
MHTSHRNRAALIASLLATSLLATGAHAQTATATTTAAVEDDAMAGEIIVTARRSSERLQDVPLSITAQSGEAMLAKGITDLESLSRFTPSLQYKDFVTTFHGNPVIRGLQQVDTTNPVGNVGVFIDGIYLQRGYMVDVSMGDWARVESVKGPQSALYGQNTFAGAINFVTNTPGDEFEVNAQVTAGNYGRKEAQIGIGGPIIKDILSARLFVGKMLYDGSWKNNLPVSAGNLDRFGGSNREAYSAKVVFTPTDTITVTGFYQQNRREEELRPYYAVDGTSRDDVLNCGPLNPVTTRPSLFCGRFPVNPAGLRNNPAVPEAPFSVEQPPTISKTEVANITAGWQATDQLYVQYQYGHAKGEAQEDIGAFTNTFNPTGVASRNFQHEGGRLTYNSHEFRAAWKSDSLDLEAGYLHWKSRDQYLFYFTPVVSGQPRIRFSSDPFARPTTGTVIVSRNADQTFTTDSVFGRASVKLLDDRLTLGAEGRYNWTDIAFLDLQVVGSPALEATYKTFAPRFTIDYRVTSNNLLYASVAKGLKNGGFNGRQTGAIPLNPSEQAFGEEENWTYEIGSKNSFFGGAVIANVAAFYVNWNKKQNFVQPQNYTPPAVPVFGTVPPNIYAINGAARSYGIEVDGLVRPTRELTINYALAWMNPEYKDGVIAGNFLGLCTGINCPVNADISGNQIERTSKFAGTLGFDYTIPVSDRWDFFVGGDVTYQSKQFTDIVNATEIAPYAIANTRIGFQDANWKAWFWTNNLFDKQYIQSVFVIQNVRNNQAALGERRTIGVTVAANF